MYRLLPLLLAIAVLLCGLHLGEPDVPHEVVQHAQLADGASNDGDADHGGTLADSGHHHCPVAPDPAPVAVACAPALPAMFAAAVVRPMASIPQAPPIEPPLA